MRRSIRVSKKHVFFYAAVSAVPFQLQARQPNFVWFMTEDVSSYYLSMYNGDGQGASTPNVRKMALEGVVFNNAFCNAPVSSPARSTIFTGCYANKLGVGLHRKYQTVDLPDELKMFPYYLGKAGYYTTNSTKKDYNCKETLEMWTNGAAPEDAWRNRPDKTKPFFHVLTTMLSHEGTLHFPLSAVTDKKTIYNPNNVVVSPNHPNTSLFRYTYASFFDKIDEADALLGEMMAKLKADGELDNTFVFYFGDNGGVMPGTKGYTTEIGLHVPLVVYVPKNWRDSIDMPINSRINGFVSFVDFAPTLLHLAGLQLPPMMDGKPFLGTDVTLKELETRNETYAYGDRFDELYAFTRTLRKGDFKYARNFQPYQPAGLFTYYRYGMEAFMEWRNLYDQGNLNPTQSRFFQPQKPEELYDLSIDPYETNNLVQNYNYIEKLKELRLQLAEKMISLHDVGMYPESEWIQKAGSKPYVYSSLHSLQVKEYITLANLMFIPFSEAKAEIEKGLQSTDPVSRYWALTTCSYFGTQAESLKSMVTPLLNDANGYVGSRAVVFLSILHSVDAQESIVNLLRKTTTIPQKLLILNDAAVLKDQFGYSFSFSGINLGTNQDVTKRAEYLSADVVSVSGKEIKKIKLYVTDNQLNIHFGDLDHAKIQVFNPQGCLLISDSFEGRLYSKYLRYKGLYIVIVKTQNEKSFFKVVI
ncbi:MAG: sulfatase [Bacteroidia bacterium]|nr:sulfatase [Bacteroidia bacterium]